ncbi:MAG: hypothetical protein JST58_08865 [Bacteroidetes bacterium]|nr:hypothetical protein [Bacteroidota bacterium]
MYAINHAATALILKKRYPVSSMFLLLISVQLVELLWVVFSYLGIEYISVINGKLHLNYLPYSHSIFTGVTLSLIAFSIINWGYKNRALAIAFSIGIMSHIILDIIFHEKDMALSPFSNTPNFGLGISNYPYIDFTLETMYGIFCWWYFKGNKYLLITIILFNILDLPMMLGKDNSGKPFSVNHFILPSIILIQIVITWYFVWRYSRKKSPLEL